MTYILHPGYVRSTSDGKEHYIGTSQLIQLYGLPDGMFRVVHPELRDPRPPQPDDIHLYPREDGRYFEIAQDLHKRRTASIPNENTVPDWERCTEIANKAQLITGRSIWPSTVQAILRVYLEENPR